MEGEQSLSGHGDAMTIANLGAVYGRDFLFDPRTPRFRQDFVLVADLAADKIEPLLAATHWRDPVVEVRVRVRERFAVAGEQDLHGQHPSQNERAQS